MLNDFYARRTSQVLLFQNIYRAHGPLWRATQVTGEKLDGRFIREEFMRVNGQRAMPQLVGASSLIAPKINNFAWNHLMQTQAPAVSFHAAVVQAQTPLTRHLARIGLMQASTQQVRADSTIQVMLLENLSRIEGVLAHIPLHERPDLAKDDDDDDVVGEGEGGLAAAVEVAVGGVLAK